MIPTYIKSYFGVILVLLVFEYIFHKIYIIIHPTYASGKKNRETACILGAFFKRGVCSLACPEYRSSYMDLP